LRHCSQLSLKPLGSQVLMYTQVLCQWLPCSDREWLTAFVAVVSTYWVWDYEKKTACSLALVMWMLSPVMSKARQNFLQFKVCWNAMWSQEMWLHRCEIKYEQMCQLSNDTVITARLMTEVRFQATMWVTEHLLVGSGPNALRSWQCRKSESWPVRLVYQNNYWTLQMDIVRGESFPLTREKWVLAFEKILRIPMFQYGHQENTADHCRSSFVHWVTSHKDLQMIVCF
jgi:hypothetical protein